MQKWIGVVSGAVMLCLAGACGERPAEVSTEAPVDQVEAPGRGSPPALANRHASMAAVEIAELSATCQRSCFQVTSEQEIGYIAVAATRCDEAPTELTLHKLQDGVVGPALDHRPVLHGNGKSCPNVPKDALKLDDLGGHAWAVCVENASEIQVIAKAGKTCSARSFAGRCGGGGGAPSGEVSMTLELGSGLYYLPNDVATDAEGNIVHAKQAAFGDPRQGLTKLSPSGEELWRYPHGTVVTTDGAGNVYTAGTFTEPTDFGTGTLPHLGGGDVFVAKLDASGHVLWTRAFGTDNGNFVDSIAVDRTGTRVALSGSGSGVIVLDAAGELQFSTTALHGAVAYDSVGRLIVSGGLAGPMPFAGEPPPTDDASHAFVAQLDAAGNPLWHHVFGNALGKNGEQRGTAVAVAPNDDIIVGGRVATSIRLFGVDHQLPELHWEGAYLARLSSSGAPLWARPLLFTTFLWDIATDSAGNAIVSGAVEGNVLPYHMTMLEKIAPDGNVLWHREQLPASSVGYGSGHGVATDRCDNVYWAVDARPDFSTFQGREYLVKVAP